MPAIAYWKFDNYTNDTQDGFTFHFNSNQSRLHSCLDIGDDLLLVSGIPGKEQLEVHLLAHIIVKAKTINAPDYKYGKYRIWGDENRSKYFNFPNPSLIPLLSELDSFKSFDQSEKYAQAFQTIRELDELSLIAFKNFSNSLAIHSKQNYRFPEKQYEENIHNENVANQLVQQEAIQEKTKNKFRNRRTRNRTLVKELNELYEGRCQLCAFDSLNLYGVSLCAAHHITYVARGGEDVMSNLLLVCQNCHEAIHKCDAVFDYEKLNYDFGNGRTVPIVINEHLEKRQL